MINVPTYAKVANSLLRVYQRYTKGIRFLLVMFLTLTVSAEVWGADVTVKWAASSGALGSGIGSGTIKTGTFSWNYTRTLRSGSSYTGWSSNCIQLGKNGGVENIIFTTSAIPGTIKKVSIECASYQGKHNVAITVGGKSYLSSTATSSWTTVSAQSGSGTSSGTIQISLTGGTRALYIKSISVTYEEAAATVPVTGVSLNESTLTLTEGDSETLTATIAPANATDKTVTWSTSDANIATVSNGKVTAVAEGTAKVTVTTTDGGKTATCNVTVNPKPKYTITWNVNGEVYETTQVTEGSRPTFPATPSSCDASSNTFYGWATATWDGIINDVSAKTIYTSANNMPAEAATYHAVFCEGGGGTTLINETFDDSSTADSNQEIGTAFSNFDGESSKAFKSKYGGVKFGNSSTAGYITSKSLDLSTAFTVTLDACKFSSDAGNIEVTVGTQTKTISNSSLGAAGTFNTFTLEFDPATSTSTVKIGTSSKRAYIDNVIIATGGGASNFITTCAAGDLCTDVVHVIKGTPSNGSFTMMSGFQSTCNGPVTVTLSDIIPATGYQFSAITQSGVDAAKVTIDNTAKTVTYAKNTTGISTINVTFIEIPNYTVTLNPNYPTGKTGVFKDKEGNIINGNLEVLLPSGTASQALTNFYSSIELDNYAFDGFYTQAEGGSKRVNTGDITGNITFYAHWKEKYTITWSVNGNTSLIEPTTFAAGDNTWEMPTTDYDCSGKGFVGWTTNPIIAAQDEAPDPLYTNASQFPTATATYHAVFAEGGSGGSGGYEKLTEALDDYSGEYLIVYETDKVAFNGGLTTLDATSNYISVTINDDVIVSNATTDAAKFTFAKVDGGYSILSASGKYIGREATSNGLNATSTYAAAYLNTITYNSIKGKGGPSLKYNNANDQKRFRYFASGQQAIALYKKSGSSATYTAYTTSCATITDITIEGYTTEFKQYDEFVFGGTVYAIDDEDNKTDVTELATFTGYDMSQAGEQTVTVTYLGHQETYTITVKEVETWHITWNVSGATNTGIGPRYVAKGKTIGECSRTGDIQIPAVPTGCTGKTFIGWTESNTVPEDGVGITYINKDTKPDSDKTYYAVFAIIHNVCTRQAIENIADGSKVVIVAGASVSGTSGKAISSRATTDTHNLEGDEVTIDGDRITTPHVTCLWIINKVNEGVYRFEQNGKYLNGIIDGTYSNLKYLETKDSWNVEAMSGKSQTYTMESKNAGGEYIEWYNEKFTIHNVVNTQGEFDMQFYLPADLGSGSYGEDYTTGCHECTITYYGFSGGYSTPCGGDDLKSFTLPVNSAHTIPNCGTITDPSGLKREFLGIWNTKPHGGKEFKPGDTFILTQDTTFYAQWKLETDGNITLPTDLEDLAGTDIYVYGGTTLKIQSGTTTINSLTLKGGIQADGSYKMPTVWVPEGATLVRNSNKIYLDLKVNAKNYYPFAVPFRAKNGSARANWDYVGYIDPVLKEAATYRTHFVIKTYDGAKRAKNGENRDANWVIVNRDTYLEPGIGYIITAMTAGKDTATIRIPMTVPNEWLANGELTTVNEVTRNQVAVTAHTGTAASEHQRHAGWNFVANPYLSYFTGGGIDATNELDYIDGKLIINSGFSYGGEAVPYVTIPAYDFSCYTAHKLSDIKLSPEYSFFVQVGTSGTMDFTTTGRQQAPAALRSNMDNPRIETDIVISHNQQTADHTGLIIDDRYTTAYEIGADLEKMFGSAYNTTIYTLGNDVRLAYNALSHIEATIPIPLGFRAETDGEYTISLTNPEDILTVESIVLQDSYNNTTTNLLLNDYTFYTDRTQDDQRFVVYIVPHNNAPTDISTIIDNDTETRKVIHNHRLYIIHNGHVYDGVGQTIQ